MGSVMPHSGDQGSLEKLLDRCNGLDLIFETDKTITP